MLELRIAPPPELPEDLRRVSRVILEGLVEGRYGDVAALGNGEGMPADVIARVIGELSGPLVQPPQGLPPSTS